jgi:protein-disulfide isomerase
MKTLIFTVLLTLIPNYTPAAEAATLLQGNRTARLQITVYGDIQCPFTARLISYLGAIKTDFGNRVGVTFSHFPLSFHTQAKPAAIAANCAEEQGRFFPFLKEQFAQQSKLGLDFYVASAKKLGMNEGSFQACLLAPSGDARVDADIKAGEALGVNSTPTLTIGEEVVVGALPYQEIKAKIEHALQK